MLQTPTKRRQRKASDARCQVLPKARIGLVEDGDEFHLFHGRVRYGESTRGWRRALVLQIVRNPNAYPGTKRVRTERQARTIIDEMITRARVLTHALHELYGTPDLGNVRDPVAELVFIVLCRRTRISTARAILEDLRRHFPHWEALIRKANERKLRQLLTRGGFGDNKLHSLKGIIQRLIDDFGSADLSSLYSRSDKDVISYLTSLPGVNLKSAQCVMLYALQRNVFPVDTHTITVLSRLGTLEPLIGPIQNLEHRKAQRLLQHVIPPTLRGPLHVNLVAHGQAVCKRKQPACDACELRKFCAHWRKKTQRHTSRRRRVLVDLFCGAGGLSHGFLRKGYRVALAVDSDPSACRTFALNHPEVPEDRVICANVDTLTHKPNRLRELVGKRTTVDVLTAGLPCQGFSKIGYRTKPHLKDRPKPTEDPRNRLYRSLLRAVDQLQPRSVLVENVPDMRSVGHGHLNILRRLEQNLKKRGYTVQSFGLDAALLGLPQVRHRLFIIAFRGRKKAPDARKWLLRWHKTDEPRTLADALQGLPRLRAGEGAILQATRGPKGRRQLLFHHQARPHNAPDLELFSLLQPGDDARVAYRKGGRRLMRYSISSFHDKYFRLCPDQPCRTIVSHLHKDANSFIHPVEDRGITAREAARVQGFPDDYIFLGSRCDAFIQIGNAVPPPLAEFFASYFDAVRRGRPKRRTEVRS